MNKRRLKHVTVLGSGVMGSGIACHLANAGLQVRLLDLPPKELTEKEKAKGLKLEHPAVRNRVANEHLAQAIKSKPAPLFASSYAERIQTGNFEDDLAAIAESDWVIEVIIERLDIKQQLLKQVDAVRKEGTLVTSNTSGIPIHMIAQGLSQDFREHFCGTHFFNPPRYLRLFEIIPGPDTKTEVIDFFVDFSDKILGKQPVLAKDTPGFIGNRIGVYSMAKVMELAAEHELTIEEADALTGSPLGRPKTGTFKLADLVGLDTAAKVTKGLQAGCKDDEMVQNLKENPAISFLLENNFLGDKTRKGFYYKEKNDKGEWSRYSLDLKSLEYRPTEWAKLPFLEQAKQAGSTKNRIKFLLKASGKYGDFLRQHLASLFAYSSARIPEISDSIYAIDDALKTGYAWKMGPFETWDLLGFEFGKELITSEGYTLPEWIGNISDKDFSFYKVQDEVKTSYNPDSSSFAPIPNASSFIILNDLRKNKTLWSNEEAAIIDLGDGIINLEFRSKMNSIGGGVLQGIQKAIDMAEESYEGVVIANQGTNFSVGANLAMIMLFAAEQDWFELNRAIKMFQDTVMRVRYSAIPVVVAPHAMTLGGGCEITMHSDLAVASAETYIGLVEFGVGVIPGGGGTKEFALRTSQDFQKDDLQTNRLREAYLNIAMAKVATSAVEAKELGILREWDVVVMNQSRQIGQAKKEALRLAEMGYTQPIPQQVKVLGRNALGMFQVGSDQMATGQYISEHDQKIADKLAHVMVGGNLSEPTLVSEQYLLDLEREAFLSLCGERKTLERIQHMLKTGKPLRN